MKTLIRLTAISLALTAFGAAQAGEYVDDDPTAVSAVDALESNLRGQINFQVDTVKVNETGIACIQYHVANDNRGDSPGLAVVDGDKVLTSSTGNRSFEDAWNLHCAE